MNGLLPAKMWTLIQNIIIKRNTMLSTVIIHNDMSLKNLDFIRIVFVTKRNLDSFFAIWVPDSILNIWNYSQYPKTHLQWASNLSIVRRIHRGNLIFFWLFYINHSCLCGCTVMWELVATVSLILWYCAISEQSSFHIWKDSCGKWEYLLKNPWSQDTLNVQKMPFAIL